MLKTIFIKNRLYILYGVSLALLLVLLKLLEIRFLIISYSLEIYIGFIAVIFTALGIWLAIKLMKPKVQTVVVEKEVLIEIEKKEPFIRDEEQTVLIGLSKREMEVLELMSTGLSNGEIAEKLFVSIATVKTHTNRIFEKMDVQRRTQAIEKAKRLKIIP
ncbi:MAG: helix-turn-helix transcriptional regulator [Chitinophaga sp.]|jgi:two-component system, NarL family, response regulator LiaR|nr:helix-turn-helix transcriptional regulator [Chitinophaga sp.]